MMNGSWRSGALVLSITLVLSAIATGSAMAASAAASGARAVPTSVKPGSTKRTAARRTSARAPATAVAVATTTAVTQSTPPVAKYAADPAALKRGRQLFVGSCGAYCHSTHDEERDAPSLFDCTWRHGGSDAEIFASISTGYVEKRMPGWKGVLPQGDDDIWRVIAYLRSASTCNSAAVTPAAPAAH